MFGFNCFSERNFSPFFVDSDSCINHTLRSRTFAPANKLNTKWLICSHNRGIFSFNSFLYILPLKGSPASTHQTSFYTDFYQNPWKFSCLQQIVVQWITEFWWAVKLKNFSTHCFTHPRLGLYWYKFEWLKIKKAWKSNDLQAFEFI